VDEPPRVAEVHAPKLNLAMVVWATTMTADQVTTYQFSSRYRDLMREENPIIRGLDRHPALLVAAGTAIDAATGWAVYRFLGRKHPRLAQLAFYGAAAYRLHLASHNLQMMQRAQNIRDALGSPLAR
jgi:hypothetical protein